MLNKYKLICRLIILFRYKDRDTFRARDNIWTQNIHSWKTAANIYFIFFARLKIS